MKFNYVHDTPADWDIGSLTLYPADKFQYNKIGFYVNSRKFHVPALYGNQRIVQVYNNEDDFTNLNSKPITTTYFNPLQNIEQRRIYLSVQPQSYTILI